MAASRAPSAEQDWLTARVSGYTSEFPWITTQSCGKECPAIPHSSDFLLIEEICLWATNCRTRFAWRRLNAFDDFYQLFADCFTQLFVAWSLLFVVSWFKAQFETRYKFRCNAQDVNTR